MKRLSSLAFVVIALSPGAALAGDPSAPAAAEPAAAPSAAGGGEPSTPDPVQAELYTMGTGGLLWEKFGHSALCMIHKPGQGKTVCYNYGTTDFGSTASLISDFLRGRSLFWVSTSSRRHMITYYKDADRSLWRQPIPLAPERASELDRLLQNDALEENRYYRYDHYHDNCASRLRDMLDRATGGALSARSGSGPEFPTFRELTRRGFAGDTPLLLASDLLIGRAVDRRPTGYEAMFLPEILRTQVESRLGARSFVVFERQAPPLPTDPGLGGRWLWAVLAIAFAAPVAAARRLGRGHRLALACAAFPLGLIGLVLWAVAVISTVPELRWNEALLVFLPVDAALPFLSVLWRTRYAAARAGLLVLVSLLLAVGLFRQPLWLLIPMPLLTMLLVAIPRRAAVREVTEPELVAAG